METIHISTLSDTLRDGHAEIVGGTTSMTDLSVRKKTYIDEWSNQMYLVTTDLNNNDIINIEKVEQ
jgi:hypothetical protein